MKKAVKLTFIPEQGRTYLGKPLKPFTLVARRQWRRQLASALVSMPHLAGVRVEFSDATDCWIGGCNV